MSKRLPNPWEEVILVRNGVIMIKFNSKLVNVFDIFGISISGINRNANTLIQYLKKYLDTTKYWYIAKPYKISNQKLNS